MNIKNLLFALVVAMSLVQAETKYGIGTDVLGGESIIRVTLDNMVKNVRIEPRFLLTTVNDTNIGGVKETTTKFGIGSYYGLNDYLSAGGFIDFYNYSIDGTSATKSTTIAALIKVEKDIIKHLSVAFEAGFRNNASKATGANSVGTFSETYALTLRLFY